MYYVGSRKGEGRGVDCLGLVAEGGSEGCRCTMLVCRQGKLSE